MNPGVAVVTGGASGMGRIFALRMAARGTQVALLDRNEAALAELAAGADNLHAYPCDVSDRTALQGTCAHVEQELGAVERLAHCAAIFPCGRLDEQDEDSIHRLMAVNYGGTVSAVRALLPGMRARDSGEIIIFGSIGGVVPVPGCGAYCATKAAVNSFAESLIEEQRDSQVHVMLVCPPLVDTPLLQQATATGDPKMVRDSIAKRRFADPEKIIDAIETGLERRTDILFPGADARGIAWLRRFFPGLLRRSLRRAATE